MWWEWEIGFDWINRIRIHKMNPVSSCVCYELCCCCLRPWSGLHRLPQSCGHDASPPTLGYLLLPHDHHAGPGHTGTFTHTQGDFDGWLLMGLVCDVHTLTLSPPVRHPVCEPGGPDDVGDWPVPSPDQTRSPARAAADVCLRRLLPDRTGHGHAGEVTLRMAACVRPSSSLFGIDNNHKNVFFSVLSPRRCRVASMCSRSMTTSPAVEPACCFCPSSSRWPSAGSTVRISTFFHLCPSCFYRASPLVLFCLPFKHSASFIYTFSPLSSMSEFNYLLLELISQDNRTPQSAKLENA